MDEDTDDVYPTQVSAVHMDDSQLVTQKLKSGNYLRVQVVTGAHCNVMPDSTKSITLANVTPRKSKIIAYGGTIDDMVQHDFVVPVTKPISWISSMVVVQ